MGVAVQHADASDRTFELAAPTSRRALAAGVQPRPVAQAPVAPVAMTVELSGRSVPLVDGRPHWPAVATAAWIRAARMAGVDATDCTYDWIDSVRDADDAYAGTVQVGQEILDLYVDQAGVLRVVTDGRYLR